MMTGMEAALKGVLAKLDPKELEGQIQVSSGLGSMLKGKKARYWEIYEKMYAQISDHPCVSGTARKIEIMTTLQTERCHVLG